MPSSGTDLPPKPLFADYLVKVLENPGQFEYFVALNLYVERLFGAVVSHNQALVPLFDKEGRKALAEDACQRACQAVHALAVSQLPSADPKARDRQFLEWLRRSNHREIQGYVKRVIHTYCRELLETYTGKEYSRLRQRVRQLLQEWVDAGRLECRRVAGAGGPNTMGMHLFHLAGGVPGPVDPTCDPDVLAGLEFPGKDGTATFADVERALAQIVFAEAHRGRTWSVTALATILARQAKFGVALVPLEAADDDEEEGPAVSAGEEAGRRYFESHGCRVFEDVEARVDGNLPLPAALHEAAQNEAARFWREPDTDKRRQVALEQALAGLLWFASHEPVRLYEWGLPEPWIRLVAYLPDRLEAIGRAMPEILNRKGETAFKEAGKPKVRIRIHGNPDGQERGILAAFRDFTEKVQGEGYSPAQILGAWCQAMISEVRQRIGSSQTGGHAS